MTRAIDRSAYDHKKRAGQDRCREDERAHFPTVTFRVFREKADPMSFQLPKIRGLNFRILLTDDSTDHIEIASR